MAFELNSCCGLSLRTGTIIIGVIQSIGAFMFASLVAAYAQNANELVDMSNPSMVPEATVLKTILIIMATALTFQCLFSIFIIFAAATNRPNLLLPWLVLNPISLFVYIISTLIAIIQNADNSGVEFIMLHLAIAFAVSVLVMCKILVVLNFYRQLKKLNF